MTTTPTGVLNRTAEGYNLVLTRTVRAPVEDVWASVTEPDRTARWFGPWQGEAGPGKTVRVQMAFEEQAPWCDLRIHACDPPRHLVVAMTDSADDWRMELNLSRTGDTTELSLAHRLATTDGIGEIGAGWEYYLDMLIASREDSPLPSFEEYYPAQKAYFENLKES
ncbi:uncharacterized protein YndB with AHSA1/START domain [Lipingzhangella halophila]|uniref:Uncharacterized protein YndB with AHSA1/START domain n=1 Tax=Lipingzhangella halophila TaxID=1783352 RepID=A0A7W7RJA5_9ACTN|nr:SRPBCC family protein [Lipingzhangella halophila]MBB4932471.1 uncharacterized protein YndB with AHSA1/START domain [Lipingzhangella halophila]